MDKKILAICPSIRPDKLDKMLDSFLVTRSKSVRIIINHEIKPITKIFNELFENNPDEDFYMLLNDDILFETPLWDLKLSNALKISYGNDGLQGENLPTFPMIDGNIVRALGWLQMPELNKYNGDMVWKVIGKELKILRYCPEVSIKHKWEGCSDVDANNRDMQAFADWLSVAYRDINKVKNAINK